MSELIYVGISCGIFGAFVGAVLFSELWRRVFLKPEPEIPRLPTGNSIFEIRGKPHGVEGTILRVDCYDLGAHMVLTHSWADPRATFRVFVDGCEQFPPPGGEK